MFKYATFWAQALRPYSGTNSVSVGAYGIRSLFDKLFLLPQVRESQTEKIVINTSPLITLVAAWGDLQQIAFKGTTKIVK